MNRKLSFSVTAIIIATALTFFSCSGDDNGNGGGNEGTIIFCQTANACVSVSAEACLDLGGSKVASCEIGDSSSSVGGSSSSVGGSSSSIVQGSSSSGEQSSSSVAEVSSSSAVEASSSSLTEGYCIDNVNNSCFYTTESNCSTHLFSTESDCQGFVFGYCLLNNGCSSFSLTSCKNLDGKWYATFEACQDDLSSSSSSILAGESGTITDERDNRIYKWVKIGEQTWLAENSCYNPTNSTSSCPSYGRLYNWATAMNLPSDCNSYKCEFESKHQGVCPKGWHVPNDAEWDMLWSFVEETKCGDYENQTGGYCLTAGKHLKAKSWPPYYNIVGADTYGFSVLPDQNSGNSSYLWSSTEHYSGSIGDYVFWAGATFRRIEHNTDEASWVVTPKTELNAVRCIKD